MVGSVWFSAISGIQHIQHEGVRSLWAWSGFQLPVMMLMMMIMTMMMIAFI